jgi:hypothetical protein
MSRVRRSLLAVSLLVACSDGPPSGGLVDDPAVELGCATGRPAAGQVRAKRIACAEELIPGRLASGRTGDILLENARIRLVIRQLGEGFFLIGTSGGGLIDAAPVGGEDVLKELQPSVALHVGAFEELAIVEAGDSGPAEVVVRGQLRSLAVFDGFFTTPQAEGTIEHRYRLAADSAAVELITTVTAAPGMTFPEAADLADVVLAGGDTRSFLPGAGFEHAATAAGETLVLSGPSASYALGYAPAEAPVVSVIDTGGILVAVGPQLRGEAPSGRRWLGVGDGSIGAARAAVWEALGASTVAVSGTTAPSAEVFVGRPEGPLVTVARAAADGTFTVRVPPGSYRLEARAADRAAAAPVEVTALVDTTTTVPAGARGALDVTVTGGPARLTATADGQERRSFSVPASGHLVAGVPPGSYHLTVSRGMEHSFYETDVTVVDDATVAVTAALIRVLDTAGWVAADFHLHSEMSTDSTLPLRRRVSSCAEEGLEYAVSSDHDFITDYQPEVDALGLSDWLTVAAGDESSGITWGHLNAWPLVPDPARAGQGAVVWFDRTPGELFDLLRGGDPARVVMVNHPRFGTRSLFDTIDFDPLTVTARADPAPLGFPGADLNDFDFDAVEVANGIGDEELEEQLADWLALVGTGHRAVATGASDSHEGSSFAGSPRTYVFVGEGADVPGAVDGRVVDAALRERRAIVSGGAFVNAWLVDPSGSLVGIGDTVTDTDGTVELAIKVQAAPYLPLAAIRVLVGGELALTIPLDEGATDVVRYDARVTLPVFADTFIVVVVDPAGSFAPVVEKVTASFTNPLFIDHDGDGAFDP